MGLENRHLPGPSSLERREESLMDNNTVPATPAASSSFPFPVLGWNDILNYPDPEEDSSETGHG
jgi:hypothetical protein